MLLRTLMSFFFTTLALMLMGQGGDSIIIKPGTAEAYINAVSSKAKSLEAKLDKKSAKALAQLKKQEEKIIRRLSKLDSSKAKQLAETARARYEQLEAKLNPDNYRNSKLMNYVPGLDSAATTLSFLNSNSPLLSQAKEANDKIKDALGKVDGLKAQLQKAEDIKAFLKERKEYLKTKVNELLSGSGSSPAGRLGGALKKVNKTTYYYAQQINEYKNILNDPKKIEKKALELLSKTKIWKEFFRKNSMLASLFRIPDPDAPMDMASLAGLQTRAQVNALVQQQIASGGPNAQQVLQQNMQAAQSQLNELKNKILKAGGGSSDDPTPDFKPNNQKTKTFLQRLEYGANIQTQKATNYFPVTSDIGLSLGYKLTDKAVIGIGASYKVGLGRGWNNISITSQGAGLRSYADIKLKGSFWISGGYEKTLTPNPSPQSGEGRIWRSAGLIGISKVVSIKSKLFKKTKLMLLWDMLSYQQVPRTQPVVFRIGYNIK